VYVGDVAWTLRVRARPGRHADAQSPRYTYTNPGIALIIKLHTALPKGRVLFRKETEENGYR